MKRNTLLPLLLLGTSVVAGCATMAPKYTRPEAPVPGGWPSGATYGKDQAAEKAPEPANLEWRKFITDENLQRVIETALANNRDLRMAALNVEMARTRYGLQRSELLPTIAAAGNETRQSRTSVVGYVSSEAGKPAVPVVQRAITEQDSVSLGMASWEIDFFGRIRSLKKAALQQYFATEQAQRAAQILLVSEVANTYHAMAADRENLKLAETTLGAQQGIYDLVKRRFEGGIVAELDVQRAQTQVDAARGDSARFTQLVAQDKNALDFLVGAPVADELLPTGLDAVRPPMTVSPGTSSEILLSRPDVLQAEALLKAANANIGAARAAFFPRISLTAGLGTASNDLSQLFGSGTSVWTYAPQVVMPIFDMRTWHAAKLSEEEKKLAIAQYERAIQGAFREVADALAASGSVGQQLSAQESLVGAVEKTYRLSDLRYTKGLDSYLSVLDAQRSLYAAQQGLVYLRLAKIASQVRLYAVLGGGWEMSESASAAAAGQAPPKTQ